MLSVEGMYRLYAGESNMVQIPKIEVVRVLAHTHPAGEVERLPSFADINTLNGIWENQLNINPMAEPIHSRLEVKHELSHYLDFKNLGKESYSNLTTYQKEKMVLDRLQKNRVWNELSPVERDFSIDYVKNEKQKLNLRFNVE